MKIISGYLASRTIKSLEVKELRPTTQRVKEAIFSSLENKIDFSNKTVLDLYAGSGSLGIEAISRGAKKCDFVEKNKDLIKCLKSNLETLGVIEEFNLFHSEVNKFLKTNNTKYDVIFADPPYGLVGIDEMYNLLVKNMNKDSIFIFEQDKNGSDSKLEKVIFNKIYGDTKVSMITLWRKR